MIFLKIITILIATYITTKLLKNAKEDVHQLPDEKSSDEQDVMVCNTEEISGQIYVWNKDTCEFITQGKTVDQIVNFFKKTYPNKKIILTRSTNEKDRIRANG